MTRSHYVQHSFCHPGTSKSKSSFKAGVFLVAQMRALRDRILELKDSYEGHIEAILDKYASLRRQVNRYHNALETAMAQSGS
jgi:hypothetical protein